MNNKVILSALASDLKRISMGLQRKSFKMADRFSEEALKRKMEVSSIGLHTYMQKVLASMELSLKSQNMEEKAEDVLMYSTLIHNYVQKKCSI